MQQFSLQCLVLFKSYNYLNLSVHFTDAGCYYPHCVAKVTGSPGQRVIKQVWVHS